MNSLKRKLVILMMLSLMFLVAFRFAVELDQQDAMVLGLLLSIVTVVLRFVIVKLIPVIGKLFGKVWTYKPGRIVMTGLLVAISLGYAFYKSEISLPPFGDAPFVWLASVMSLVDGVIAWATVIYNFGLKYVNDWMKLS